MKVSQAIKLLSEIDPDEEIAISWWESNLFTDEDNNKLLADSKLWLSAVAVFDANGGYDSVNQLVWDYLNYDITQEGDF
jgi:hypothetical protein